MIAQKRSIIRSVHLRPTLKASPLPISGTQTKKKHPYPLNNNAKWSYKGNSNKAESMISKIKKTYINNIFILH
jgi:hypothetical protein